MHRELYVVPEEAFADLEADVSRGRVPPETLRSLLLICTAAGPEDVAVEDLCRQAALRMPPEAPYLLMRTVRNDGSETVVMARNTTPRSAARAWLN